MPSNNKTPSLTRIPTGVAGLDEITAGGLLSSGVYLFQGTPGAGKTILANQICFHHVRQGGHAVYLTMLSESHARLFQHLQGMAFFDLDLVASSITFLSGFEALQSGGLDGVIALLRGEMRTRKAELVVLDGLVMASLNVKSAVDLKLFISELQAFSALVGCTTLLLASDHPDSPVTAEQAMVDGIVKLRERSYGPMRERNLEVMKFRGSATLRGNHAFAISDDGITVYPRLEAALRHSSGLSGKRSLSTGVEGLDDMMGGKGYALGTVTGVIGYAGAGRTVLALHFVAQATPAEPALYFGFYESPDFLVQIGESFGLPLKQLVDSGSLRFVWQQFGENMLDQLAYRLLKAVRDTGAKRVVIDGIGGFVASPAYTERGSSFFASLTNELRRLGAATLFLMEEDDPSTPSPPLTTADLSALSESVLNLWVQNGVKTRRFLSIGKIRNRVHDQRRGKLVLSNHGLRVMLADQSTTDSQNEVSKD